jgi:hypothetical protein
MCKSIWPLMKMCKSIWPLQKRAGLFEHYENAQHYLIFNKKEKCNIVCSIQNLAKLFDLL